MKLRALFFLFAFFFVSPVAHAAVAPTCSMTTVPSSLVKGASFTLKWTSTNATSAVIPGPGLGNVKPIDQRNLIPVRSTRFVGTFTGPGGKAVCEAIIVVFLPNGSATPVVAYDDPDYDDDDDDEEVIMGPGSSAGGTGSTGSAKSSGPPVSVSLAPGSSGPEVTKLQEWLISQGYSIPSVQDGTTPFGFYGSETKAAVSEWQHNDGGFVGPAGYGTFAPFSAPATSGSTGTFNGSSGSAQGGTFNGSSGSAQGGTFNGPSTGGGSGGTINDPGTFNGSSPSTEGAGTFGAPGSVDNPGTFSGPTPSTGSSADGGSFIQPGQAQQLSGKEGTGLVPCGRPGDPGGSTGCQACSLATLAQRIVNFLIGLSIPLAAAAFAYAGVIYFTSSVFNKIEKAKKVFSSVFIGFCIVVGAWVIVQTLLSTIFRDSYKGWNEIQCVKDSARNTTAKIDDLLNSVSILNNLNTSNQPQVAPVSTAYSDFYSGDVPYAGASSAVSPGYNCNSGYTLDNGTGYEGSDGQDVNTVSCVKVNSSGDVIDEQAPRCRDGYSVSDGISDPGASGYRGLCVNGDSGSVEPVPLTQYGSGTGSAGTGNSGVGTQQWREQLQQACARSNMNDCTLAQAIMANESSGRPNLISPAGAVGLMQVLPTTACSLQSMDGCNSCRSRADNTNGNCSTVVQTLLNPTTNMQYGTLELARLSQSSRTGGDPGLIAAAYNGGLGAVFSSRSCDNQLVYQCSANGGYAETRKYVPNVLGTYNTLKK